MLVHHNFVVQAQGPLLLIHQGPLTLLDMVICRHHLAALHLLHLLVTAPDLELLDVLLDITSAACSHTQQISAMQGPHHLVIHTPGVLALLQPLHFQEMVVLHLPHLEEVVVLHHPRHLQEVVVLHLPHHLQEVVVIHLPHHLQEVVVLHLPHLPLAIVVFFHKEEAVVLPHHHHLNLVQVQVELDHHHHHLDEITLLLLLHLEATKEVHDVLQLFIHNLPHLHLPVQCHAHNLGEDRHHHQTEAR